MWITRCERTRNQIRVWVGTLLLAATVQAAPTAKLLPGGAAAASDMYLTLPLDTLGRLPLSGPDAALSNGVSLAPDAVAPGPAAVDSVPFDVAAKGLDVSASMAGIKEAIRAKYAYQDQNSTKLPGRLVARLPPDQYAAVHVLAFSRKLPGAVPRMTVRIGMFGSCTAILEDMRVDVPDILGEGGAPYVVSRVPVKLADGKEGSLYHLRIPFARTGNLWEMRRSLSLEFTRDMNAHVNLPDPNEFSELPMGYPSSVVVLGATMERSPVTISYTTAESGNVFYEDQKPVFNVKVTNRSSQPVKGQVQARCAGPGTAEEFGLDRKAWTVSADYAAKTGETVSVSLDVTPPSRQRGWYECTVAAAVDGRDVQTRDTTFAILAPDTRKAFDESPFGVWEFWTSHSVFMQANEQYDKLASLMKKGGWRWTYGGIPSKAGARTAGDMTAEDFAELRKKYGVRMTTQALSRNSYQRDSGWFDAQGFADEDAKKVATFKARGYDNAVKVLHESRSSNNILRRFNEFLGGEPYDMPDAEKTKVDKQFENVRKYCEAIRKVDPTLRIVLINDYPAVAIEYMKRGFPNNLFDIFGLECANFMREPERQPDWLSILGHGETMRRAMKQYGYEDKQLWTTEALYHGTAPGYLTLHQQGVVYAREALMVLANGFSKMAAAGILKDSTDDYYWSNWGSAGFCNREPEINPKPSYVMMAWLTQVLDMARFAGFLAGDSTSLHVLDFQTPAGAHVYPVWVPRGQERVQLKVKDGRPVVYDCYGNTVSTEVKDGLIEVTASDAPVYVTQATLDSVVTVQPIEVPKDPGQIILDFDKPEALAVVKERSEVMEGNWDYPRIKGQFKADFVNEDGATALRVELQPDDDQRTLFQRYVEFALAKPIVLDGRPFAFTARVKGNGAWGRVMFEMIDAKGRVWTSCGNQYAGSCNASDNKGDSFVSFDGWQTMEIPVVGQYPGADQFAAWPRNFDWWPTNAPEWLEVQKRHAAEVARYAQTKAADDAVLAEYNKAKKAFDERSKTFPEEMKAYQAKAAAGEKAVKPKKPTAPKKPKLGRKPTAEPRDVGIARVDYPVKLTKVIVAMAPHMLYVNHEIPVAKPVIHVDRIGVRQPPDGM